MSRALICLTPSESKRLIAKAVAALPVVKNALENGLVIVVRGSTTCFVVEEILGREWNRLGFVAGYMGTEGMMRTPGKTRISSLVLKNGEPTEMKVVEALDKFERDDVFIKGANMVDPSGMAGGLLGNDWGGTTGESIGALMGRGSHMVVPVGLEKLVPSVAAVAGLYGNRNFDHVQGDAVGMMPLVGAQVVTEVKALEVLFGVQAWHAASGGVGGAEGSVALIIEGDADKVAQAFDLACAIKGAEAFPAPPRG